MGLIPLRVYLDSCIVIYLIEEHQIFAPQIENYLAQFSDIQICTSDLTEMGCLILPLRSKNQLLTEKFRNWFQATNVLQINNKAFQEAAQLRADFSSLKTPDALHISTALHHNCDEFWTNDNRLDKIAPNLVKNILKYLTGFPTQIVNPQTISSLSNRLISGKSLILLIFQFWHGNRHILSGGK